MSSAQRPLEPPHGSANLQPDGPLSAGPLSLAPQTKPLAVADANDLQRHRVLLIDDQPMIGEAVRRLIAGESDIAFEFCRDADAALDAAAHFRPTVILQDLVMPGIEGLDMVRRFRAVSSTQHVPVIVLSAKEEPAVKAEMLTNGASDYLVKLPDRVELLARLRVHSEGYTRLLERNAAFRALEQSLADLEREKERSEKLLLNILPAEIADRLKDGPATIAESFPSVTVLFADLCGFTEFSETIEPRQLVGLLDEIFSAFDQLAGSHGVEKIKTIGDAYMAVAGLPIPRADHADAVARMALGMQEVFCEVMKARGLAMQVRIGIHTGPVVAGVIGRHKFTYDLWGDTVNLASRMESHGEPSRIHVSQSTREILGNRFRFADRGEIQVKGKGLVRTSFLLGRAAASQVEMGRR